MLISIFKISSKVVPRSCRFIYYIHEKTFKMLRLFYLVCDILNKKKNLVVYNPRTKHLIKTFIHNKEDCTYYLF